MLRSLRERLKKVPAIYNLYMRIKRSITGELLGMTSRSEQDYLYVYSKDFYKGVGEIVELGSFLGATSIPLARGLLQNPSSAGKEKKIHVYDLFVWSDGMNDAVAGTNLVGRYKAGDKFVDEYRRRTAKYSQQIEIHDGDLNVLGWSGGEIAFLLVDAMKSIDLANSIVHNFYGSLIPNEGLVMHQDFAHYYTSWIHLLQWRFRDHFEFEAEIPASSSVVFRYTKQIPDELLKQKTVLESFSDEEVDVAFSYSSGLVSAEKLPHILASKVMYYIHTGRYRDAQRTFDSLVSDGVKVEKHLVDVQNILKDRRE